ncbi:MAG: hypothetical protein NTY67_15220 [Cyanobacteria bacterium]|nr:hypothetical protein [Cyanobacteriota bacterium]
MCSSMLRDLLRGFQQADELSQRQGVLLMGHLAEDDPKQLYGGLITVLMRLVFLLYAEDNALLPKDAVYEQNYKGPQAGRPTNCAASSAAPVIWRWRCGRCPAPPPLS